MPFGASPSLFKIFFFFSFFFFSLFFFFFFFFSLFFAFAFFFFRLCDATLPARAHRTRVCALCAQGEGGPEFGLFQPKSKRNNARWLKMDRQLDFYELRNDDQLEYKKRMRPLKVKLEDGTVKTVLIDDSESVEGVVAAIGKKMNLKNYEEFTLKYDSKDQWLTSAQSLTEQGLTEKVRHIVCPRRNFCAFNTI